MPVLDQFFPFDRPYGAPASAALWGKMAQQFAPDGVVAGALSNFNSSIAGGQITVQNGACLIHGYYGEIQTNQTFAVGTNGMVVIGVDMVGESVSCYYKDGVTDYNGLTQSATLWEIPLYQITGVTLADRRSFINPGRGLITGFSVAGPYGQANGAVANYTIGFANITHSCVVLCIFQAAIYVMQVNAGPQNVFMQGYMDWGLPDQVLTANYEILRWPGGSGVANDSFHIMTGFSYFFGANPGRKGFGLRIGNGTGGPGIQVANMGIQILQLGTFANG